MSPLPTISVLKGTVVLTQKGYQKLLKRRIRESGLSSRVFAEQVMARDERTVRRWLAGSRIPKVVQRWLEKPPSWWPPRG